MGTQIRDAESPTAVAERTPGLTGELLASLAVQSEGVEQFLGAVGAAFWSSPLRIERLFLSLQTLHPAFRARTYLWQRGSDRVDITEWPHGLKNRRGYYDSPDYHVHRSGNEFRIPDLEATSKHRCDLYGELKVEGFVEYLMMPLLFSDGTINTLSVATKLSAGFPPENLSRIRSLNNTLVVILERYAALETVNAALETYLGRSAARQVLSGHIQSGQAEEVEAAILFADLDQFTKHTGRLDPTSTVRLLNDYFDCLVGPIEEHGGYVLKFIGDAVLAFFPILDEGGAPSPMDAAQTIQRRLAELNRSRQDEGRFVLEHALCVHFGRVLYGNVGSSERLDFTIIGEAVNVAARGMEAAKSLGSNYLFTKAFAERFGEPGLASLGFHTLRGVSEPLELYALESR